MSESLSQLEQLEKAATPSPWTVREAGTASFETDDDIQTFDYPDHIVRVYRDEQGRRCTQPVCEFNGATSPNHANAELNAALRNAAPRLIAIAKAAQKVAAWNWGTSISEREHNARIYDMEQLREALKETD